MIFNDECITLLFGASLFTGGCIIPSLQKWTVTRFQWHFYSLLLASICSIRTIAITLWNVASLFEDIYSVREGVFRRVTISGGAFTCYSRAFLKLFWIIRIVITQITSGYVAFWFKLWKIVVVIICSATRTTTWSNGI